MDRADASGRRGRDRALRTMQHGDGWWKGVLDTNVTMDAEDLMLREFLGILDRNRRDGGRAWIRSQQRDDGTWATFYGGPATCRRPSRPTSRCGSPATRPTPRTCATPRRSSATSGGIEAARVFTRFWLALFGLWSWDDLPAMPPEVVLLPPWFPLNIYDFACWARQTIVPLTVVGRIRPVRPLPFGIDELRTGSSRRHAGRGRATRRGGRFQRLDRLLQRYERRPLRRLRERALRRAEAWIIARQEADGSWGGIQPPWVYSLMALHLRGYALDHPVMRGGLAGLERFSVPRTGRPAPARGLPVAGVGHRAGGDRARRRRRGRATTPRSSPPADWLLGEEIRLPRRLVGAAGRTRAGRLGVRVRQRQLPRHRRHGRGGARAAPGRAPGLGRRRRAVDRGGRVDCSACSRRDGGWAAFDVDNTARDRPHSCRSATSAR